MEVTEQYADAKAVMSIVGALVCLIIAVFTQQRRLKR